MDLNELAARLAHGKWQALFSRATVLRGQDYAQRGKVHGLALERQSSHEFSLAAKVNGSGSNVYSCHINLDTRQPPLVLDSACSCPVGWYCKHAVAALASVQEGATPTQALPQQALSRARSAENLGEWEHWLQTLAAVEPLAMVADAERCFGIVLRASQTQPEELLALPAWVRPSKTSGRNAGKLVDPQPLTLSVRCGPAPTPEGGWRAEDAAALATLLQAPPAWIGGKSWSSIRSAHVEHALSRLLERFPAWWERPAHALSPGAVLPVHLVWQEETDGSQRLQLQTGTAGALMLRGAGLWYVHPQRGEYGRVDVAPELADAVARAPALAPGNAKQLREHLLEHKGPYTLPAPRTRALVPMVGVVPTPVLYLQVARITSWKWLGQALDVGIATLLHDYDGVRVPHSAHSNNSPVLTRLQGDRVVQVHRNASAEARAHELLQNHGLMPLWLANLTQMQLPRINADATWLARPAPRQPPLAPQQWQPLIDALQSAGVRMEYAADFPHEERVQVDDWYGTLVPSGGNAWFDVSLGVEINGQRVDLLPILRQLIANPAFPLSPQPDEAPDASWRVRLDARRLTELPLARLRALIEPLLEWLEGSGEGVPRVHRSQVALLDAVPLPWRGSDALRAALERLRSGVRRDQPPKGFGATLRPYQRDGLAWLNFLADAELGGILADDMGLGKTVQLLAHIACEKERGALPQPALVVVPTSLLGNWVAEAVRFTPQLKVLVLHGPERAEQYKALSGCDLALTTYPLLPRDRKRLAAARFSLLVLDEAQAIKNAASQAAHVVREIPATRRLAMTGTPLENHLGELWAQLDAVEPGVLGNLQQFNRSYRTPIEKHGDSGRQAQLNRRIRLLLLRRRKEDVLRELPAKTEIIRTLELSGGQRRLYETLRVAQHERVQQAMRQRGLAQSGIVILDALLKLRQVCCDPRLVKLASARKVRGSAKLDALLELLEQLLADGRRVLLFSQFTEMLALIGQALDKRKLRFETLTGKTPARERTQRIQRFQAQEVPLFLISLKAGGVGLNLTAADTVIHYDPWWNPAVEAQATDRAHRMGQDRPVFVYRLICSGTVEEKIQAMQARKAELARAVLEGGGAGSRLKLDEADLAELFAPL